MTAPLRVTLGDAAFQAVDWSLGGCRLSGLCDHKPSIGSEHVLQLTLPFQGFNISLKTDARVVRHDDARHEVALQFIDLGDRETALMQHFIEDLVRGKMTEVEDTIVRIDTPVTPVPIKPDANPPDAIPVRRWPIKQILFTLFYLGLGALVFGYVGVYVFATVFRMEVTSAVVSAERITITAPFTGRVKTASSRNGRAVIAGQVLAVLEDTSHEDLLRRAQSTLAATRAELAETQALLFEEERRAQGYALVARNNVRQAESQLAGMELARDTAELKLIRKKKLFSKGLVLADEVAEAELELKSVISDLERKTIHIAELKELIEGGDSVRLFTGADFAGRVGEMEARAARLTAEISHHEAVVAELLKKDSQQHVIAPFKARIIETALLPGASVKQGEPLFVLEALGSEKVSAFVTQDEVLQVRVGSPAKLYVPSQNRWLEAEVAAVDRTAGFVDEVTETFRFRAPEARSAQVILHLPDKEALTSGTPVTVYFERHRNNVVWRTTEQLIGVAATEFWER